MMIHTSLADLPALPGCVVTAGTFDGVHLGHRRILDLVRTHAHAQGLPAVVITYWPHPRLVLFPEQTDLKLLSTQAEKRALIEQAGIDVLVELPFTRAFSQLTYAEYVDRVIVGGLQAGTFVLGHDHAFGAGRAGSFETMGGYAASHGLALYQVPVQLVEEAAVSSSKIRQALAAGQVEAAARLLGRPYAVPGTVVHGQKLGRTLGYPTANLEVDDLAKLLPGTGVYAAFADTLGGARHGAMVNVGHNPTIAGKGFSIEAHLFDFRSDLYGQPLTLHFIARLRDELKFDGLAALTAAIAADEVAARAALGL